MRRASQAFFNRIHLTIQRLCALLLSRLERVKKQKGAALKMQHRDKRSRKKKMRAKGRVDDPSNWQSMM
jgi:hypothetical protein